MGITNYISLLNRSKTAASKPPRGQDVQSISQHSGSLPQVHAIKISYATLSYYIMCVGMDVHNTGSLLPCLYQGLLDLLLLPIIKVLYS